MRPIPLSLLPADPHERQGLLETYFAFDLLPDVQIAGDVAIVELVAPSSLDYYVDPRLEEGLMWWNDGNDVRRIPRSRKARAYGSIFLNDAWTLLSWSRCLTSLRDRGIDLGEVVVLHADDHEDLMSPRLLAMDGRLSNAITGAPFDLFNPATVVESIETGAIGMGSFVVPFLHDGPAVDFRHLKVGTSPPFRASLATGTTPDALLQPGSPRPMSIRADDLGDSTYFRTSDPKAWVKGIGDRRVLLHLDLDYFNNRFDGDSDWREHEEPHDPMVETVLSMVDSLFDAVLEEGIASQIIDVAVGVSPGFFPAELWEPTISRIESRLDGNSIASGGKRGDKAH